jgi:hypothetical protein
MILRAARPEDRPALVAFMAALQDFEREIEPNRTPGAEMADKHLAGLEAWVAEHPCGGVFVAEAGGALAGFIIFGVAEEFGELGPPEIRLLARYLTSGSHIHSTRARHRQRPDRYGRGAFQGGRAEARRDLCADRKRPGSAPIRVTGVWSLSRNAG